MGWREQVHIGELTVDALIMSDQAIPGNRTSVIAIDKDAAYGINLTGDYTTNAIKVNQGSVKFHLHNQTAQTYACEIKFDAQNVTGVQYGIDCTCEIEPGGSTPANRTSGGLHAVQGISRLQAGYTLTAGSDPAIYGQFYAVATGVLNGAALYPCAGYLLLGDGGTWTQVGFGQILWLDTHMAQTVSAGSMYMLNMTHNGTGSPTTFDAAVHVYAGNAVTNLLKIDTASGMVSANTIGDATFANWKTIKVDLDGTTHYLIAAQAITG